MTGTQYIWLLFPGKGLDMREPEKTVLKHEYKHEYITGKKFFKLG